MSWHIYVVNQIKLLKIIKIMLVSCRSVVDCD